MTDMLTATSTNVTRHRFFKGCTRPAMFIGVPLMPFLLVSGCFLLLIVWCMQFVSGYAALMLFLVYVPMLLVMRQITKKDDQRLRQMLLRMRMRVRHLNKPYWQTISFAPLRYKKRI